MAHELLADIFCMNKLTLYGLDNNLPIIKTSVVDPDQRFMDPPDTSSWRSLMKREGSEYGSVSQW